ncbi:MAG: 6-phosphogluconolactonase [Actinobacteria bacterium]|nr:6-phosphogluconolactonase [Actinomycetota bacterium]
MPLRLELEPDAGALAFRAAGIVAAQAQASIADRGAFAVALSGGSTPAVMLDHLARRDLPWGRIHVFQVDERIVPDGDSDRNATDLLEHLVGRIEIPPDNVHLMPVTAPDLAEACRSYAGELAAPTGSDGRLDLVHLGLGGDGHTASWPPGDPVADAGDVDVVVVGPYRGHRRMTLTPPVVNRARRILWLVSGESKADAVEGLVAGDSRLPASRVATGNATLVLDQAAASKLELLDHDSGNRRDNPEWTA